MVDWLIRSVAGLDDGTASFTGHATISVDEEGLMYALEGETGEDVMKEVLAGCYEGGPLNVLQRRVEILAYARRAERSESEPDAVLYDIRYRPVGG